MSRERALAYLADHQVMTLATAGPGGAWAAAVFYVNRRFDLYFLSAGQTRHGQQIADNPHVAATIQEDYPGWEEIKGIQLAGVVSRLAGEERTVAIELYRDKYPFLEEADPALEAAMAKVNWYQLRPLKLYFIDNSRGFGHRDQII